MIDVETVVLEDNKEYIITRKIIDNSIEYLLLSDSNDVENFCIRKIIEENNEKYIVGLDSKEEFDKILNKITEIEY